MDELIIKKIKSELQTKLPNSPIEEMLALYEQFANLKTEAEKGISGEWIENVVGFYELGKNMQTNHNALLNSESFLKKVLYVVDKDAYDDYAGDKKLCLYKTMDKLGLFKNLPQNVKVDRCDPETLTSPVNRAVVKAYQLRNNVSHTSDDWALSEMFANVNAILLATMYAVWQNRGVIRIQINKTVGEEQFGITSLLNKTVKEYNTQKSDGFVYVPLLWESENSKDEEAQQKTMNIAELLEDKHILLSGEAGCGKTTSLQYLEYQAANSYLSGESAKIPVNIALINESASSTLQEIICRKLNISLNYCEKLLENGLIYLFVDGLNELTADISRRKEFVSRIEQFFNRYPRVFVVVTDRKYSSYPVRVDKTYHLKRMEKTDIVNYAKTKSECDNKTLALLEEVLNKEAFADLEYTPLIVNQLILTLSSNGQIPNDMTDLIGGYLEALMKRECEEKRDNNAAPGKLDILLMKLASEDDCADGIKLYRAMKICGAAIREYEIGLTSDEGIALAIQMGILKKSGDYIEFAFDEYRTHYFMKAIDNDVYN